jgi:hypothetical protein
MTSKAPDATATEPNFASAEYAEQWRRGNGFAARLLSEAVTKKMLALANLQVGDHVLLTCNVEIPR